MAIGRSIGQPFSLWIALSDLGFALVTNGQGDRGRALLDEALAVARGMGHPGGVNQALRFLGVEALQRDDIERATSLLTESLNGFRALGDLVRVRETGWVLGYASLAANDPDPAIDRFMESAALCRERSDQQRLGLALRFVDGVSYETARPVMKNRLKPWLIRRWSPAPRPSPPARHASRPPWTLSESDLLPLSHGRG